MGKSEKIRCLEQQVCKLEAEIKTLEQKNHKLHGNTHQLTVDRDDRDIKIKKLEGEITQLNGKTEQLTLDKNAQDIKIEKLKGEIAQLNEKNDQLTLDKDAQDIKIEKLKGEIAQLNEKNDQLTLDKDAQDIKIGKLRGNIAQLNEKTHQFTLDKDAQDIKIEKLKGEIEQLTQSELLLETEKKELKDKYLSLKIIFYLIQQRSLIQEAASNDRIEQATFTIQNLELQASHLARELQSFKYNNQLLSQRLSDSERYNLLKFLPRSNMMWPKVESKKSLNTILENAYKAKTGKTSLTKEEQQHITLFKHAAAKKLKRAIHTMDLNNSTEYENAFCKYANDLNTNLDNTNFYGNPYGANQIKIKFDTFPSPNQVTKWNIEFYREFVEALDKPLSPAFIRETKEYAKDLSKSEDESLAALEKTLNAVGICASILPGGTTLSAMFGLSALTLPAMLRSKLSDDLEVLDDLYHKQIEKSCDDLKAGKKNQDTLVIEDLKIPGNKTIESILNENNPEQELKTIIDYNISELKSEGLKIQDEMDIAIQDNASQNKETAKGKSQAHLEKIEKAEFASALLISLVSTAIQKTSGDSALAKKINVALNAISTIGFASYKCSIGALKGGPTGLALTVVDVLKDLSSHFWEKTPIAAQDPIIEWFETISAQLDQLALQLSRMEVVQQEIIDRLKSIASQIKSLDFNFSKQIALISDLLIKKGLDDIEKYRFQTKADLNTLIEKFKTQLDNEPDNKNAIGQLLIDIMQKGEVDARSPDHSGRSRVFSTKENFGNLFSESTELEKFSLMPRALELLDLNQKIQLSKLVQLPDLTLWILWASTFANFVTTLDKEEQEKYEKFMITLQRSLTIIKQFLQELFTKDSLDKICKTLETDLNQYCDEFEKEISDIVRQNIHQPLQTLTSAGGNISRRLSTVLSDKLGFFDDFTDKNDQSSRFPTGFDFALNKKPSELGVSLRHDAYGQDRDKYHAIVFKNIDSFKRFFTDLEVRDSNFKAFDHTQNDSIYYLKNSSDGKLNLYHSKNPFKTAEQAGLIKFETDSNETSSNHIIEKGRIVFLEGKNKGKSIPINRHHIKIKHDNGTVLKTICVYEDTQIKYSENEQLNKYKAVLPDAVMKNNECIASITAANIVHFALNDYFDELNQLAIQELKNQKAKRNIANITPLEEARSHVKLKLNFYIYLNQFISKLPGQNDQLAATELYNLLEEINALPDDVHSLLETKNELTECTPTHAGLRIRFNKKNAYDILHEIITLRDETKKVIHKKIERHRLLHIDSLPAEININCFDELEKTLANPSNENTYWSIVLNYFNAISNISSPSSRLYALKNNIFAALNTPERSATVVEATFLTVATFVGGPPAAVALTPVAIDVAARVKKNYF